MASYDYDTLMRMDQAYHLTVEELFGRSAPDEDAKDVIAKAILFMARVPDKSAKQMAAYAGATARLQLRKTLDKTAA